MDLTDFSYSTAPFPIQWRGSIVVRSPNWLGDAIMAFPAVRNLKQALGSHSLTIATPAKLAALWNRCSFVDSVLSLDEPRHLLKTAAQLREKNFTAAVLLPNSFRAAAEARLGKIPIIFGYENGIRNFLLYEAVQKKRYHSKRAHQQYFYIDLMTALGAANDETFPLLVSSKVSPKNRLAIFPGAEYGPAKRWPATSFAAIAQKAATELKAEVVLLGVGKDRSIANEIASSIPEVENRVGETSLEELMKEIEQSRLVLSNDSGAMHLASALGIPTVAIFGSTEPRRTGPLGPRATVLRHHVPCSPCFLRECPLDFDCMHSLTPEIVWESCREKWSSTFTGAP